MPRQVTYEALLPRTASGGRGASTLAGYEEQCEVTFEGANMRVTLFHETPDKPMPTSEPAVLKRVRAAYDRAVPR